MSEAADTPEPTQRVRTTMPLEIDGARREAGHEMELPHAAAAEMVERRRAELVADADTALDLAAGEPLKLTDAERAALPDLGPAEGAAEMGYAVGQRPDDAHPGDQVEPHGAQPVQPGPVPDEPAPPAETHE